MKKITFKIEEYPHRYNNDRLTQQPARIIITVLTRRLQQTASKQAACRARCAESRIPTTGPGRDRRRFSPHRGNDRRLRHVGTRTVLECGDLAEAFSTSASPTTVLAISHRTRPYPLSRHATEPMQDDTFYYGNNS